MKELLVFLADLVFGFLKGKDEDKHKRIVALVLICLLLPPSILYSINVWAKIQWAKNNPNAGYVPSFANAPNPRPNPANVGDSETILPRLGPRVPRSIAAHRVNP
jgi:hypothetical protein